MKTNLKKIRLNELLRINILEKLCPKCEIKMDATNATKERSCQTFVSHLDGNDNKIIFCLLGASLHISKLQIDRFWSQIIIMIEMSDDVESDH